MASYVFWSVDLCRLAEKLKFLVTCQVSPDRKIAIQIISNALIVAHSTGQSNPYWIHSVKGTLVTEQSHLHNGVHHSQNPRRHFRIPIPNPSRRISFPFRSKCRPPLEKVLGVCSHCANCSESFDRICTKH